MALLKVLLLLLGLGVSVNSGVSLQKRIIGGLNCDDGERLHHVRLESSKGDKRIRCGGSLIHPEWILTAAHCWKPGWSNLAVLKVHPQTAGQQIQVIQYATQRKNGLILLKLQTPVTDVRPAQLPNCRRELGRGDNVKLAGEGGTTPRPNNKLLPLTDAIPSQLQCVNMKVVQVPYNHPTYGHIYDAETTNKDMCKADVGGAAMHNGMIYGVAFFSEPHYTCQSPVVIKDVCDSLGWIKETVIK